MVRHAGFSPEYVDTISPLDRKLYWAYYLEESKESQKSDGSYTVLDNNIPKANNMHGIM